jgi:glycosyltransferase involved in cell wall biosynthesis
MRIAIEALGIHSYGGGRTATINLLQALFALDRQNEYLLFLSQPETTLSAPNVRQTIVPLRKRFFMRLWAQIALPVLTLGCDVVHFVKNLGVFGLRVPFIVTVYDITTIIYPELFPKIDVWYWHFLQKHTLHRATKVIAISQKTAQDICIFYGISPERSTVVYPSCGRHFKPTSIEETDRVRKLYTLPEHYVLHVGRIDPKKNIPLLIEAFAQFRKHTGFPGTLVLVGEQYKKRPDLAIHDRIAELGLQQVVQLLGAIPDPDLPAIYTGATMAAFPSVHEGFGLVALEALACGTPLVVNRAGAITEVVGDAALVMAHSTPECLAELLAHIWRSPELRQQLREAGRARSQLFSWEATARQTLAVYEEIGSCHEGSTT